MQLGVQWECWVAIEINVERMRRRGRPKKRWKDKIDNDMKIAGVSK